MKDINTPVRAAFYNLLNGSIAYNGTEVKIYDEIASVNSADRIYVLLSSQNSVDIATKHDFTRRAYITLDIVVKTDNTVSKTIPDSIAGRIAELVMPTPARNGLTPPPTWQFLNLSLSDDRYISLQVSDTAYIIRRLLTFQIDIVQN